MGLVDYSDSDVSDAEDIQTVKPTIPSTKAAFRKVVDRTNPGKIRVSLPQGAFKDNNTNDEPPTKRAKTAGGAFSGFNSFLPAPKRTGQATNGTLGGGNAAKKGLGAGVSLKTGAAPGFSRHPEPEGEDTGYLDEGLGEQTFASEGSVLSLPPPQASKMAEQKPTEEVRLLGKQLMFKPLSVARKPAKKKKQIPQNTTAASTDTTLATPPTDKPAPRPKVSLFSISREPTSSPIAASTGDYQPMMYEPFEEAGDEEEVDPDGIDPSYEEYTPSASHIAPPAVPTPPVTQSLNDIAGDLNLSAAERRQLFGRQNGGRGGMQSAAKIINFNTDEEYLQNEELRAAGEQVVHNPVRAIAPGKHSLKQLVNAAQNQREALEESFAKGKSNRAEASSRYGW